MTVPIDLSKPEARPVKIVFYTDTDTGAWLGDLATGNDIELSLVCHRICKAAREQAMQPAADGERRTGDDRRSA